MTIFTIIAAVMILVALVVLAPALLRKRQLTVSSRDHQNVIIARERLVEIEADLVAGRISQDEFDLAKMELEQALLQDLGKEESPVPTSAVSGKMTLGAIAVAVPLVAISMYAFLGAPEMIGFDPSKQASHNSSTKQGELPSVEQMLATIKQRLQENPDDAEGWFLLGRTYMALDKPPEAVQAYETLLKLTGDEPMIMLSLADAVAMVQGGSMQGRPTELIHKTLQKVPDNPTALWMAGIAAEQEGRHQEALAHWQRLLPLLKEEPKSQAKVQSMIDSVAKNTATGTGGRTP
jgi:cytochrome c-type biogenesis protein CcmH